jgi:RimJ/RimL family protein N-acetyltransferase
MAATETPIETTLRDGTRVRIRQVSPGDRAEFVESFDKLSTRSRYLRFHTAMEELSDAQLDYLTQVDQVDHVAWVAIDLDDPDRPGIGVARFVRLDDEPHVAEAAVTVLDAYQGRGLGTLLLRVLADAARARDIDVFRAYVLGENRPMLSVLDRLGPTSRARQDGVYQIDVDLGPAEVDARVPAAAPDRTRSPAEEVFRAVTGKHLPAMRTTAPPVWMPADDDTDGDGRRNLHEWLDHLLVRRRRAGDSRPPRRPASD